jgi:tRNA(Ile)-lysidine synthase
LFVPALRALQPDRRRNALRFWIARSGVRVPDTSRLEELAGPVIDARPDANPIVAWGEAEVQRHADVLSIRWRGGQRGPGVRRSPRRHDLLAGGWKLPRGSALAIDWPWRAAPVLELPDEGGRLELQPDPHGPIDLDALPAHVTVRHRQGGERLRPRRGGPRRTLKSLLQESRLAVTERGRLPLVFSGSTLLAVGSLWIDESVQITATTVHRGRLTLSRRGRQRPS